MRLIETCDLTQLPDSVVAGRACASVLKYLLFQDAIKPVYASYNVENSLPKTLPRHWCAAFVDASGAGTVATSTRGTTNRERPGLPRLSQAPCAFAYPLWMSRITLSPSRIGIVHVW